MSPNIDLNLTKMDEAGRERGREVDETFKINPNTRKPQITTTKGNKHPMTSIPLLPPSQLHS